MLHKCVMQQRISTGKHSPKMMEEYEMNLPQRKINMKNLFIISADWFFTALVDSHQKKHCCDVIHISNDAKTIVIDWLLWNYWYEEFDFSIKKIFDRWYSRKRKHMDALSWISYELISSCSRYIYIHISNSDSYSESLSLSNRFVKKKKLAEQRGRHGVVLMSIYQNLFHLHNEQFSFAEQQQKNRLNAHYYFRAVRCFPF